MVRRGRPTIEQEPLDTEIHVRVTKSDAEQIDQRKGKQTRAGWVRDQIKKGLR